MRSNEGAGGVTTPGERDLGYTETACALAHERFDGWGQPVRVAEISGPLDGDRARRVLTGLRARHPLLRARLIAHEGGYRFWLDDPPIVLRVGERPAASSYRAIEEAEQADPIDPAGPLWRVTLLLDRVPGRLRHVLVYTSHHAVSDGLAACMFVDEFLRGCAAEVEGQGEPTSRPLPPAIEQELAGAPSWAQYTAGLQAAAAGRPALDPWPYAESAPIEARVPRVVPFSLGAADLRRRARAEGVSLNAALAAALLRSAAALAGGRLATMLSTSVNLRPRVRAPACARGRRLLYDQRAHRSSCDR